MSEHYKNPTVPAMGYMEAIEQQKKADDQFLSDVAKEVEGVFGQLQTIAELLRTNKEVAPVENLAQKIKEAYQKIKAILQANTTAEEGLRANNRNAGGLNLEKNPLIEEMGGMPLETISSEWQDLVEGTVLDKAELENLVNNKLKARVELANKLKLKNKPTNQPALKAAPALTPKFKLQKTLEYILKEAPPAPMPRYTPAIPPPRPGGM